jgi:FtsZ-binding cell division protein ZapB
VVPLTDLIAQLGGVDIEKLRSENQSLKQNVDSLVREKSSLEDEVKRLSEQLESRDRTRRLDPPIDRFETEDDEPFSILGLPTQASSDEIARRYEVLKAEYEALFAILLEDSEPFASHACNRSKGSSPRSWKKRKRGRRSRTGTSV